MTPAFKLAVEKLCELRTKPIAKFKELAATSEALAAAEFLRHVVEAGNDSCDQVAEGGDTTIDAFCMEWARSVPKQIFEIAEFSAASGDDCLHQGLAPSGRSGIHWVGQYAAGARNEHDLEKCPILLNERYFYDYS